MTDRDDLDARLIAAHAAGDLSRLARLYGEAADGAAEEEREAFYLVHAMVFALEAGDRSAEDYRARLRKMGRET